jgi:hypothetical protein
MAKLSGSRAKLLRLTSPPRLLLPVTLVATILVGAYVVLGASAAGGRTCTRNAPTVQIQNTYGWGKFGSWVKPGETYPYDLVIHNNDVYCRAATFNVSASLPEGFTQDTPNLTVNMKSTSTSLQHVHITSPVTMADGDYPVHETVARATDSTSNSTGDSLYRIYSSDTAAPVFGWWSPTDGQTVSNNPYFVLSLSDEHRVQRLALYVDNNLVYSQEADPIAQYDMQFGYTWPTRGVARGAHTMMAKGYDGYGNVTTKSTTFILQ